jgi:hypothetical protein
MKRKVVKKLWQGRYVSVRDYEVKSAIRAGGLEIIHNDQRMVVPVPDLKELTPTGDLQKSKTGGRDYYLMDILFQPIVNDPNQPKFL